MPHALLLSLPGIRVRSRQSKGKAAPLQRGRGFCRFVGVLGASVADCFREVKPAYTAFPVAVAVRCGLICGKFAMLAESLRMVRAFRRSEVWYYRVSEGPGFTVPAHQVAVTRKKHGETVGMRAVLAIVEAIEDVGGGRLKPAFQAGTAWGVCRFHRVLGC